MVRHVKPSDYVDAKDYVAQVEDTPLTQAVDAYLATEPGTEAALYFARKCRVVSHGGSAGRDPMRKKRADAERVRRRRLAGICISCSWPAEKGKSRCWHHGLVSRLKDYKRRHECNCHQTPTQLSLCFSEPSSASDSSSGQSSQSRMAS